MESEEESLGKAFVVPGIHDNAPDMSTPAGRPNWAAHPLLPDRGRLERITDLMWLEIQKTMFPGASRRSIRNPSGTELTVMGGVSAEDVLREALADLLKYESEGSVGWEGLAITIARRRAVDAVRAARKNRVLPDGTEIDITSLDSENEDGVRIADTIADPQQSTDEQVVDSIMRADRLLAIGKLALNILSQRDRDILFRVTRGETNVAVAGEVGLTPQRVGQIYATSIRKIYAALRLDPTLYRLCDPEGGTRDE
ncbi:MAG: sigma-70 family polymerase sigma factor [Aeromicrobium sp.]|nr:sigma-70 family polymerase sigma factor [Aeromicrobium sp.]